MTENDAIREAYRRGYSDRAEERDYDPGHALDLLDTRGAALDRIKGLIDAWSDPEWSGHDTAAPFVRALRKALDYPDPTRPIPPGTSAEASGREGER